MKKLSTRVIHFNDGSTRVETKYRLHIESSHVTIMTDLRQWPGVPDTELRVDFWTSKTRWKLGGSHRWDNPVAAFRIISTAIQALYEGQIGKSRLFVFAADDQRLRIYRRILERIVRKQGGQIIEGFRDEENDGCPGLEYKP